MHTDARYKKNFKLFLSLFCTVISRYPTIQLVLSPSRKADVHGGKIIISYSFADNVMSRVQFRCHCCVKMRHVMICSLPIGHRGYPGTWCVHASRCSLNAIPAVRLFLLRKIILQLSHRRNRPLFVVLSSTDGQLLTKLATNWLANWLKWQLILSLVN